MGNLSFDFEGRLTLAFILNAITLREVKDIIVARLSRWQNCA